MPREETGAKKPIDPIHLACPSCGKPHIDEDVWATRPHKTHRCVDDSAGIGCGVEWEAAEKCISTWEPGALIARTKELLAKRWPGRWRVGSVNKHEIWAPHPDGIGGWAGERLLARLNHHFPTDDDARFIASAPQIIEALTAALEQAMGKSR